MAKNKKDALRLTFPSLEEYVKSGHKAEEYEEEKTLFLEHLKAEKAEFDKDPENHSYPPHPGKDRQTFALREAWKQQNRVKCAQPKCCYPLNQILKEGQLLKMAIPEDHELAYTAPAKEGDKPKPTVAYAAKCSWDPRHMRPEDDSPQYITHDQMFPNPDEPVSGRHI